ncbi:hypothetical protein Tco_0503360 [Tanacetum coccineum]
MVAFDHYRDAFSVIYLIYAHSSNFEILTVLDIAYHAILTVLDIVYHAILTVLDIVYHATLTVLNIVYHAILTVLDIEINEARIRHIFLDGYGVLVVRIVFFRFLHLRSEMRILKGLILQVITLKIDGVQKEEKLKKCVQTEDLLQDISEDEPENKDDTSPKKDVENGEDEDDCQHYKYTYSSKQEDPIIRLADQRQHDDISRMQEEADQKVESEIRRLYKHREARLNKIAKEDKQRKGIGHTNSSAHMKLAIERCIPKKRKFVDVIRSLYNGLSTALNVLSMEQLANQKNLLNPLMIEKMQGSQTLD